MNWFVTLTVSCAVVQITVGIPNPDEVYHSLAFVFDTTGSMYDDYVQLKSHAEGIMNYVLQRNNTDIKHFVFVPFNDPGAYVKRIGFHYCSSHTDYTNGGNYRENSR